MCAIRAERDYVISEDFMKAVRKVATCASVCMVARGFMHRYMHRLPR